MLKNYDVCIANPAGNTTVIVISPTPRELYQEVAGKLLAIDYGAYCNWADSVYPEQVAFIIPESECEDHPRMEMCGLEFCGNASRSFAYYRAIYCGDSSEISVSVSGCDYPLQAKIDTSNKNAKIQMPVPSAFERIDLTSVIGANQKSEGILVDLDGISHLVIKDVNPSQDVFDKIRRYVYESLGFDFPAFGVMFLDSKTNSITPVVYVKDVNTTYFEGSCASGTTATTAALVLDKSDGEYDYSFVQPAGTLCTHAIKDSGKIKGIDLDGSIELSQIINLKI